MYDRFINACRTRIAEHSKAAAAQGKDAHTSSPRDSKPPCVLIVFHGTADENIKPSAVMGSIQRAAVQTDKLLDLASILGPTHGPPSPTAARRGTLFASSTARRLL